MCDGSDGSSNDGDGSDGRGTDGDGSDGGRTDGDGSGGSSATTARPRWAANLATLPDLRQSPQRLTDPPAAVAAARAAVTWTEAERATFLTLHAAHGKDWRRVAAGLPSKTLPDIVRHYYDAKVLLGLGARFSDTAAADTAAGREATVAHLAAVPLADVRGAIGPGWTRRRDGKARWVRLRGGDPASVDRRLPRREAREAAGAAQQPPASDDEEDADADNDDDDSDTDGDASSDAGGRPPRGGGRSTPADDDMWVPCCGMDPYPEPRFFVHKGHTWEMLYHIFRYPDEPDPPRAPPGARPFNIPLGPFFFVWYMCARVPPGMVPPPRPPAPRRRRPLPHSMG